MIWDPDNRFLSFSRDDLLSCAKKHTFDQVNIWCFKQESTDHVISKAKKIVFVDTDGKNKFLKDNAL